jgi:hypothetical protein
MSVCASCGQDNPSGFRFCGACGTRSPPRGDLPERGYALLAAGRCLTELGRPGARERLAESRAVFAALGARPLLALADGGLAEVERSG